MLLAPCVRQKPGVTPPKNDKNEKITISDKGVGIKKQTYACRESSLKACS